MDTKNPVNGKGDLAHKELVALLERFTIPTQSFDGLRSDSYEEHVARRSLAELTGGYEEMGGLRWGEGHEEANERTRRTNPSFTIETSPFQCETSGTIRRLGRV